MILVISWTFCKLFILVTKMELEDYVEKLQKQKKTEKKERKKKEKEEKLESINQRRKLMKFTSSQKWKLSATGKKHMWKVFKERRKNYYNWPRGVVYLSSIPHGFFEEQMASYFSQFGKVTGIYMPRAPSGKIRGYAFIEFQLDVIAKIVAETMNNYLFYQRILKAKFIPPEQQKPYMFVFPFGDKRKKSLRIEAEQKRREQPLSSEAEVEAYKRKVEQKMKSMQKKMAALGTEYSIQVSGEAPLPLPSTEPNEEKSATKKKLKQIAAELKKNKKSQIKVSNKETSGESENPLNSKLAKQIQKNITAKLSKPLGHAKNKKKPDPEEEKDDDSEEGDDNESDDDFETAGESSFFSSDISMDPHDEEYDSADSDSGHQSPAKKSKQSKPTDKKPTTPKPETPKQSQSKKSPKNSATKSAKQTSALLNITKTSNKTPRNLSKPDKKVSSPVVKNITPKSSSKPGKQDSPALSIQKTPKSKKKSLSEDISHGEKAGKVDKESILTPAKNRKSLKQLTIPSTPLSAAKSGKNVKTPVKFETPKNKAITVKTPKSLKKSETTLKPAVTPSLKSKKPAAPLSPKSAKKNAKESSEKSLLKRKSMSDVKKSTLLNVEKKRKSLPK